MASTTRPAIRTIRSSKPAAKPSRERAARKIVAILEDQMTEMGLTEEEKSQKTAEFAAFVRDVVSSHAKQQEQPRSADSQG
ncbi:MAG: hypothetical protein ABSG62_04235 [Terracidiphilus sp.]|jgi:hypothetical protein